MVRLLIAVAFGFIPMLLLAAENTANVEKIALRTLDRDPDHFLGKTVTVDGVVARTPTIAAGKAVLSIVFDRGTRTQSLSFNALASIAEHLKEADKVRITGVVLAPTSPNGAFNVDIREVSLIGVDGKITATHLATLPEKLPAATNNADTEPLATPPTDAPASLPIGTILAAALSLTVGCIGGGLLYLKKRGAKLANPEAVLSVSDRLNRRVK